MGLDTEFSYYEIKVIPRVSLLKYTKNRRIFQNLNAVEIIVGLLNANKVEFETRLTNNYEKGNTVSNMMSLILILFHDYWKMKEYFIFLRSKMATIHSF